MTRINFNRYSSGGYGSPPAQNASSAPDAEPSPSLLHRIADAASRLGRAAYPLTDAVQVDGVAVMRNGGMQRWAAELGWREGEFMRLGGGRVGAV